ncbi:hypothetical protein J6590_103245, partial [Homalodisca vitripennis]
PELRCGRCSVCRQTDENAFLRMTGWRSTYTADPTREREFCLRTSLCEVDSRRRVFACGRRFVESSRGEVESRRGFVGPLRENTQSAYSIYLVSHPEL